MLGTQEIRLVLLLTQVVPHWGLICAIRKKQDLAFHQGKSWSCLSSRRKSPSAAPLTLSRPLCSHFVLLLGSREPALRRGGSDRRRLWGSTAAAALSQLPMDGQSTAWMGHLCTTAVQDGVRIPVCESCWDLLFPPPPPFPHCAGSTTTGSTVTELLRINTC